MINATSEGFLKNLTRGVQFKIFFKIHELRRAARTLIGGVALVINCMTIPYD